MNKKYLIGTAIIIIFISAAIWSFDDTKIGYSNFTDARQSGKTVQVIGRWDDTRPYGYDSNKNLFTFYMFDEKQEMALIKYHGAQPNNFSPANKMVIKGSFSGKDFEATHILPKCPSKYEGMDMDKHNDNGSQAYSE